MKRYGVDKFRIDAGHVGELRTCGARRRLFYWRYQILSFGGHDCASLQRVLLEFHGRLTSRVGWSGKVSEVESTSLTCLLYHEDRASGAARSHPARDWCLSRGERITRLQVQIIKSGKYHESC